MTEPQHRVGRRRLALLLPLGIFVTLAVLFMVALGGGDPSRVPSALVGKPVPDFTLPPLDGLVQKSGAPVPGFATADLATGEVTVMNVWASWCVPCREEHPLLMGLAAKREIRLFGLNYKDQTAAARRFLGAYGDPFRAVGVDGGGRTAIDFGVYGVPETFVIDGRGRIAYKHIGPLSQDSIEQRLMPAVEKARAASQNPTASSVAPGVTTAASAQDGRD